MSCNDLPTHSLEKDGNYTTYNSGQVRLYGIPFVTEKGTFHREYGTDDAKIRTRTTITPNATPLSVGYLYAKDMGTIQVLAVPQHADATVSSGIIFGYAFEGHCYDLPRPKLMFLSVLPAIIPDGDCGYKEKKDYRVWIVDKLDQCLELEMNQGFVEQIVLEANLPGKRSPTAYAGKAYLSHRSGRLGE